MAMEMEMEMEVEMEMEIRTKMKIKKQSKNSFISVIKSLKNISSKKPLTKTITTSIAFLLILALCIITIPIALPSTTLTAYASNINDLDDRAGTEGTAGITWDEINELSQNNPNSLTPIQGLMLWMFAIIAFLKLAQKLDNLLQSLGLNVTQTGGRAVGDIIMAGMALKHAGNALSKGMGALGLGKGGSKGGSPNGSSSSGGNPSGGNTGSVTDSGSIGGSGIGGSSPIPSGSSSGSVLGSTPISTPTPTNTSPTASAPTSSVSSSDADRPASSIGSTNSTDSNKPTSNRTAIGKAVDWMKQDGFAQGAIRAGAKGGIIGLGVYSAKAGVTKVGSAVSARLLNRKDDGSGGAIDSPIGNPISDSGTGIESKHSNVDSYANVANTDPEAFQPSRPASGEEQDSIPSDINTEEYQDSKPFQSDDDFRDTSPISVDDGSAGYGGSDANGRNSSNNSSDNNDDGDSSSNDDNYYDASSYYEAAPSTGADTSFIPSSGDGGNSGNGEHEWNYTDSLNDHQLRTSSAQENNEPWHNAGQHNVSSSNEATTASNISNRDTNVSDAGGNEGSSSTSSTQPQSPQHTQSTQSSQLTQSTSSSNASSSKTSSRPVAKASSKSSSARGRRR